MTVNPVRQILAQRRSRKRVGAGAEHSHEDRCRRGLSGGTIVDRDRVSGPIDEGLLSRFMIVPEHHGAVPIPPLIQLTKARNMLTVTYQPICCGQNYVAWQEVPLAGRMAARARRNISWNDLANLRHGGSPWIKHHVPVMPPIGSVIPQHSQTNETDTCATV